METTVWTWKQESESPVFDFEPEPWFYGGNNVVEVETTEEEVKHFTRAETATKLLEDLDQWIKDEPFPDWLEEKIDLPIFEDLPAAGPLPSNVDMTGLKGQVMNAPFNPVVIPIPSQHNEHTVLIPELEYVLNEETLTPPESPRDAEMVLTMLQEMQSHELDELVRMRVESLVNSPESFVDSSRSSLQEESDSVSSPSSDSGFDDPEWTPLPSLELKAVKKRRSTKPYSKTPPEEKKQRKKEQNKNAATRYRMKKKAEIEVILDEEKSLINRNEQLKTDMNELAREIKYLKSLMRDVFKAKGLIK